MKNLKVFKRLIHLTLLTIGAALLQSCVVYQPTAQQTVPVSDIVQMSKDGVHAKDIIKDLRHSHSVYFLKADQLARLRNEGVQDSVINYMEKTHINAVVNNQRLQDPYYSWPGMYGYGYGYYGPGFGWPYGYWGWDPGPIIIYRGSRGYGEESHEGMHRDRH